MDMNALQNALYSAERLNKMLRENEDILNETVRCAPMEMYKEGDKKAMRKLNNIKNGLEQLIDSQV